MRAAALVQHAAGEHTYQKALLLDRKQSATKLVSLTLGGFVSASAISRKMSGSGEVEGATDKVCWEQRGITNVCEKAFFMLKEKGKKETSSQRP